MTGQPHRWGICPRCNGPMKASSDVCARCKEGRGVPIETGMKFSLLKLRNSTNPYDRRLVAAVDSLGAGSPYQAVRDAHGQQIAEDAQHIREVLDREGQRRRTPARKQKAKDPDDERPQITPRRDELRAAIQAAMRRGEIVP